MDWATIAMLIAQYGIPLAESVYQKWSAGTPPTQADFDALKALASSKASDEMLKVLKSQGIEPTSPQGIAFLALVSDTSGLSGPPNRAD